MWRPAAMGNVVMMHCYCTVLPHTASWHRTAGKAGAPHHEVFAWVELVGLGAGIADEAPLVKRLRGSHDGLAADMQL